VCVCAREIAVRERERERVCGARERWFAGWVCERARGCGVRVRETERVCNVCV